MLTAHKLPPWAISPLAFDTERVALVDHLLQITGNSLNLKNVAT
jgi:hypothetical protein